MPTDNNSFQKLNFSEDKSAELEKVEIDAKK